MSRLLPGAPGQTPGLFTGPRPGRRRAGPPARPRPSDALTRSSRGRAGPLIGRGGGGDGGRARGSRDGSGRARAKEGRSRAPSSRSPRGSDHPGVGAGGREWGPREAEEAPRTHRLPPHLPGPPSPRPSHPIPSCGPGRRGDHGVLAPARAPAPRAAAASSAAPRTRALDGAAPPPSRRAPPRAARSPALQLRRGPAAGGTRMWEGRNCGEGGGGAAVTSLPGAAP